MPVAGLSLSDLWSESIRGYEWPDEAKSSLNCGAGLEFDESRLLKLASGASDQGHFVLTFLSSEYLPLGLLWTRFALEAGIRRFAIAAADSETAAELQGLGIPFVELHLPQQLAGLVHYRNRGGFSGKALALIYSRLRLVKFLIDNGIDVLCCDIDALIKRNPQPYLGKVSTIAFQRVVYFPKALAKVWGFTACAGVVAYRASSAVSALLSRVLAIQQDVSSDQLALNLALLEKGVQWNLTCDIAGSEQELISAFTANAHRSIEGRIPGSTLILEALPATLFWRHNFVPSDPRFNVILHPNSPKSVEGKLAVFLALLGVDEMQLTTGTS